MLLGDYPVVIKYDNKTRKNFTMLTCIIFIISALISTYTSCIFLSNSNDIGCSDSQIMAGQYVTDFNNNKWEVISGFAYSGKEISKEGSIISYTPINNNNTDVCIYITYTTYQGTSMKLFALADDANLCNECDYYYKIINNFKYLCIKQNLNSPNENEFKNIINIFLDKKLRTSFSCTNCYNKGSLLNFNEVQNLFTKTMTLTLALYSLLKIFFNYFVKKNKTHNLNIDIDPSEQIKIMD